MTAAITVLIVLVVVMMLVVMTAAITVLIVLVVVMMLQRFLFKLFKSIRHCILALHRGKNILAGELIRSSGYNNGISIMLSYERYCLFNLLLANLVGMREENSRCVGYLVVIKLTEVTHIHFAFSRIGNGCKAVKNGVFGINLLYRLYNVGKLTYSRRLYYYSVRLIFLKHPCKCFCKVTHKRTADTARIHFGYFYSGILKKAAVYTYFAKLVFYKHYLFI